MTRPAIDDAPIIIRVGQSQRYLGWCEATSRNMVRRKELPPLRNFGGRVVGWLKSDLDACFANAPRSMLMGPRSPGRPRKQRVAKEDRIAGRKAQTSSTTR
jgi:predicted DNA-binding transcriptional regulator AlpA